MILARDHLRTGHLTLGQIAERTGYASPYAFAAAFRRHHGQPPGQWRQGQASTRPDPWHAQTSDPHLPDNGSARTTTA
ncbi:MAG: helix-turn-helix domain-containing protein [Pseudonocardiaceae bacterium]